MAGDASVNAPTPRLADAPIPRHAQPRVAEAPAKPAAGRAFTNPTLIPPAARATNPQPLQLAQAATREADAKIRQLDNARNQLAKIHPDTQAWIDANQEVQTIQGELNTALWKNENAWEPLIDEVNKTDPDRRSPASQYIEEQSTYAKYLSLNYLLVPLDGVQLADTENFKSAWDALKSELGRRPTAEEVVKYQRTQASRETDEIVERVLAQPVDTSGGAAASDAKPQPSTDEVVQRILAQPLDTSGGAPKPAHVATKPAGKVASLTEVKKRAAKAYQAAQKKLDAASASLRAATASYATPMQMLKVMDESDPKRDRLKKEVLEKGNKLNSAAEAYTQSCLQVLNAARDIGDIGKTDAAEKIFTAAARAQTSQKQLIWDAEHGIY